MHIISLSLSIYVYICFVLYISKYISHCFLFILYIYIYIHTHTGWLKSHSLYVSFMIPWIPNDTSLHPERWNLPSYLWEYWRFDFSCKMPLLHILQFLLFVTDWLNAPLPREMSGLYSLNELFVRSSDFPPCNFFLWGWLKEQVYSTKTTTLEKLEVWKWKVISPLRQEISRCRFFGSLRSWWQMLVFIRNFK